MYAWNARGRRVFSEESKIEYSGKPLSPFVDVRKGERNRTQHGFIGSPVLADLNGDRRPEVVAAAMDRHLYAWRADGSLVEGYPVLVVDRSKVAPGGVDPATHAITFGPNAGDSVGQGGIVDTPAVANISGAEASPPEVIIGTNEEYRINQGNEGPFNAGPINSTAVSILQQVGGSADLELANANGRVYAVHADGEAHAGGPFVAGWPVKLGLLLGGAAARRGRGCERLSRRRAARLPLRWRGHKVGVMPAAGLGYILNGDGTSCQPQQSGRNTSLAVRRPRRRRASTPPASRRWDCPPSAPSPGAPRSSARSPG